MPTTTRNLVISRSGGASYDLSIDPGADNSTDATAGFHLGPSSTLYGSPAVKFIETDSYLVGSKIEYVGHKARDVVLPVTIIADDTDELDRALSEFLNFLDPIRHTGTSLVLTYTDADASSPTRYLEGNLITGHEAIALQYETDTVVRLRVQIRCPYPYWKSPTNFQLGIDSFSTPTFNPLTGNGVVTIPASPGTAATTWKVSGGDSLFTVSGIATGSMPVHPYWFSDSSNSATEVVVLHMTSGKWWRMYDVPGTGCDKYVYYASPRDRTAFFYGVGPDADYIQYLDARSQAFTIANGDELMVALATTAAESSYTMHLVQAAEFLTVA